MAFVDGQTMGVRAFTLLCCLFGASFASAQVSSLAEKRDALSNALCVLPMGQTIDTSDLPSSAIRAPWMGPLRSDLPISLVSIPATHDAGTALGHTGWTRCQILTIPAQLAIGVRGFDIRLRQVNGELGVYHGTESQKLRFQEVMDAFASYLRAHRSEFLVMRVREESAAVNPTQSFEAAFHTFYDSPKYRDLFYKAKSRTDIPTVGQARGKIVILDNYGKLPAAIEYPNKTMNVQDDYDTSDMINKAREIVAQFDSALRQTDGSVWYVNYTSSSTIKVDQLANAVAVNPIVQNYLSGKKGHLGLVLTNFAGLDIVRAIIDSNF
jgi:1-phosphatidylinositol phosphodiesterase